jgi:nitric oxide reductase NorD protein
MAEADDLVAIEEVLQQLERISFVAHRDARAALPSIRAFGPATARAWIETARDLFLHDRECGKSFMRHSERLAENTGVVEPWTGQSREFLQWVNSHYALEGFLAQADRVWSVWGEAGEREWFALGLRWCGRSLADARAYFEAPFDRLDAGQGPAGLRTLIEPAEKLYDERGLALDCYLAGAPMARNMVGDAGLLNWARRGADLLAAGRSRGEAYFRMESEEGLKLLLEALPGYRARTHGRFLQFLLRAWLEADVPLADGNWKPGEGRPMLETDGRRLYLPAVFGSRDEAIVAVQHGAAHLAFDSYAREHIEALFRRVGIAHPPLDDQNRITWRPLFAPFAERMFRFQILFDLTEDLRVNARIAQRIPGFLQRLVDLASARSAPEGAARIYYRFALSAHRALMRSDSGPREEDGRLDPRLGRMLDPNATVVDAWEVAESLFAGPEFPEIGIEERQEAYLPALSLNAARPVYPQRLRDGDLSDFRDVGDAHEEHRFVHEKQEEAPEQDPAGVQKDPDADINMPREETSGSGGESGSAFRSRLRSRSAEWPGSPPVAAFLTRSGTTANSA